MKMKFLSLLFILMSSILMYQSVLMLKKYKVSFNMINIIKNNNWSFHFSTMLENFNSFFILIVTVVTLVVLTFSEKYMDLYNIKKFLKLKLMFYMSMVILLASDSFLNFSMGWDYLGFSSIFLIMFYPNKNTMLNSILTMSYNRFGDIILIMSMSMLFFCFYNNFYLMNKTYLTIMIMMLICSFTKSAQFPLGSWLPAAMSAPTPISAMVHSSTLVTAGVFLNYKIFYFLEEEMLLEDTMMIFIFTCFIGSLMAFMELDLKKMVAFSTMSQISFIMILMFMKMKLLMVLHLFYHAKFKTLLFISVGMNFLKMMSSQSKNLNWNSEKFFLLKSASLISIFSMLGLNFSSSFFSKHLALNNVFLNSDSFQSLYFILISLGTILYSCKVINNIFPFKMSLMKFSSMKKFNSKNILIFILVNTTTFFLSKNLILVKHYMLTKSDTWLIFILFTSMILMSLKIKMKSLLFFSMEIYYTKLLFVMMTMKFYILSYLKEFMISDKMNLEENFSNSDKKMMNFNSYMYLLLMFFLFFLLL